MVDIFPRCSVHCTAIRSMAMLENNACQTLHCDLISNRAKWRTSEPPFSVDRAPFEMKIIECINKCKTSKKTSICVIEAKPKTDFERLLCLSRIRQTKQFSVYCPEKCSIDSANFWFLSVMRYAHLLASKMMRQSLKRRCREGLSSNIEIWTFLIAVSFLRFANRVSFLECKVFLSVKYWRVDVDGRARASLEIALF